MAGCLERLQLGGNEHTSSRDVVRAALSVEVGGVVSPATSLYPELFHALVLAGIAPAVACNWGCLGFLSAGRPAARPAGGWIALNTARKGRCQSSALLASPMGSLIHLCAPCLPPAQLLLGPSRTGQPQVRLPALTFTHTLSNYSEGVTTPAGQTREGSW